MWGFGFQKQGNGMSQQDRLARWRHPGSFGLVQINHTNHWNRTARTGVQQTNAARLDQPVNRVRGRGDNCLFGPGQYHPVIGHQISPHCHQPQRQSRLAAARFAKNQQALPGECNTAGMENGLRCMFTLHQSQTGRPTTNRAPSGSDVMSASVGRIFSAQITPLCASMICLLIARPKPELLPKCSSGRCE